MRYWLLRGKKPEGPYNAESLARQPEFDPDLPVCPEGKPPTETQNWRPAKSFPEVAEVLRGAPAAPRAAPEPPAAAGPRYWLMTGKRRIGPYPPQELLRRPEFEPDSLVCPEHQSPEKTRNWRSARKVKELAPWLREQAARAATPFSTDENKTRWLSRTPAPASPKLTLPPEPAPTYHPGVPTLRREQYSKMSNLAGGIVGFLVVTVIGAMAMLLTGHCRGSRPERKPEPVPAAPYVVPAPVDTPVVPAPDDD